MNCHCDYYLIEGMCSGSGYSQLPKEQEKRDKDLKSDGKSNSTNRLVPVLPRELQEPGEPATRPQSGEMLKKNEISPAQYPKVFPIFVAPPRIIQNRMSHVEQEPQLASFI